jgi:hypothetical protein
MQPKKTNQYHPLRKSLFISIALLLFMLSRSWVSDQIADRKDKNLFNLIAITAMVSFMFIIIHYKTKSVEYRKFRPLVYVGILVYLAFVIYFFYLHFTTQA